MACDSTPVARTSVDRAAVAPDLPNAPYGNVLIIGAMESRETARWVEEGIGKELETHGTEAHAFVKESTATAPTAAAVEALIEKHGIDGVIVVSYRHVGGEIAEHGEQVDLDLEAEAAGLLGRFDEDKADIERPAYRELSLDVVLVSDFYDADSEKRVYTVRTTTAHAQTNLEIIEAESEAIVERLRTDGLIR
jgi:hypothetical protein